jgi:hypothetical protein
MEGLFDGLWRLGSETVIAIAVAGGYVLVETGNLIQGGVENLINFFRELTPEEEAKVKQKNDEKYGIGQKPKYDKKRAVKPYNPKKNGASDKNQPAHKTNPTPSVKPKPNNKLKPINNDTNLKEIDPRTFPEVAPVIIDPPDFNQNPTPIVTPKIRTIKLPYYKNIPGKFIWQPLQEYIYHLQEIPQTPKGFPDYSEVNNAVNKHQKSKNYLDFLVFTKANKNDTEFEEKMNLSDLAIAFWPQRSIYTGNLLPLYGLESIWKIAEAFDKYSDGFLCAPLYYAPMKVVITPIKGIDEKLKVRLQPEFDKLVKPVDPEIHSKIFSANDFSLPKILNPEEILEFAGKASMYEGGANKWKEFKEDPTKIKNLDFFPIAETDEILAEKDISKFPKLKPQNLTVNSNWEMLTLLLGTTYLKTGLHEFPSKFPSLKNKPLTKEEKENNKNKPHPTIIIPSFVGAISFVTTLFNRKIGDFPTIIEKEGKPTKDKNGKVIPGQIKEEKVYNMSDAIIQGLGIAGTTAALVNFNNRLNLNMSGDLEQTKVAARQAAECSCNVLGDLGSNTNKVKRCDKTNTNFISAKNFQDMLGGGTSCYIGTESSEKRTIKDQIQELLLGVNTIKSVFFKGQKELGDQEKIIRDLIKRNGEAGLNEIIKNLDNNTSLINKDYPTKVKIIKKSKPKNKK